MIRAPFGGYFRCLLLVAAALFAQGRGAPLRAERGASDLVSLKKQLQECEQQIGSVRGEKTAIETHRADYEDPDGTVATLSETLTSLEKTRARLKALIDKAQEGVTPLSWDTGDTLFKLDLDDTPRPCRVEWAQPAESFAAFLLRGLPSQEHLEGAVDVANALRESALSKYARFVPAEAIEKVAALTKIVNPNAFAASGFRLWGVLQIVKAGLIDEDGAKFTGLSTTFAVGLITAAKYGARGNLGIAAGTYVIGREVRFLLTSQLSDHILAAQSLSASDRITRAEADKQARERIVEECEHGSAGIRFTCTILPAMEPK